MSNNGWRTVKLGEIAEIKTGKSNRQDAVPNGRYPFFDRSPTLKKSSRYLFDCEAIIVPGEGKEFVPRYFNGKFDLHQRAYAITNFVDVDGKFIFYLIMQKRRYFSQVATGATVKSLRKPMFEDFTFEIPPLTIQRKISELLFDYDNLIENNIKHINSLEESAERLYRKWFVKFRFPGHENVPMVDSELGLIPEGWEASRFGDVATFENGDRGKNYPKSSEFVDEGVPFINAGHLSDGIVNIREVNRIDEATFTRLSRGKIKSGDLLLCVRGSLGRIARVDTLNEGAIASSLVIIRDSDTLGKAYLYYTLSGPRGQQMVAELNNGVAQPNISVQSIKRYPILVPSASVRDMFEEFMHSVWEEGRLLHSKCSNLRAARDLLLPKLISGQLDVSELDIATEEMVTA